MPEPMRALTVRQPFAWAIAYGGKDVENRPKPLAYRGPVAIHAGLELHEGSFPTQNRDPDVVAAAQALQALGDRSNFWDPRRYIPSALTDGPHPGLALGAVIALAVLVACHHESTEVPRCSCSPWAQPDCYHLALTRVRPLAKPVPCRGMLGLWRLPGDVESAVRAQLARDVVATSESETR